MARPSDKSALSFDGVITTLARQRSRMVGADFDDLYQEGRLEVWSKLLEGETPTENDIINAMRRWLRAGREGKGVVYEYRKQTMPQMQRD